MASLLGAHQIDNAGLAAATLLTWGDRRITPLAIATGMTSVQGRGRLEPLTFGPLHKLAPGVELWVDCGSDAQAADALALTLRDMARKRRARTVAIVGLSARRDWRAFVDGVGREVDMVLGVSLGPGGVPAEAIVETSRKINVESHAAETLRGAVTASCDAGAERILVCGSFALAGQALQGALPII